jgi:hypothetical protein
MPVNMMKRIASLSFSLLISFSVLSQSLSIELISSGGNFSEFQSGSVCYSIGECVVTGENNPSITNAGFQQGIDLITSIDEILNWNQLLRIKAFPNPTMDNVRLSMEGEDLFNPDWQLSLFSSDYKLIRSNINLNVDQTISFDFLAPGIYFLQITSDKSQQFLKIIKQ